MVSLTKATMTYSTSQIRSTETQAVDSRPSEVCPPPSQWSYLQCATDQPLKYSLVCSTCLGPNGGARPAPLSLSDKNCPSAWLTHQIMSASAVVKRICLCYRVFQMRVYYFKVQDSWRQSVIKNMTHPNGPSSLSGGPFMTRRVFFRLSNCIWTFHWHSLIALCVYLFVDSNLGHLGCQKRSENRANVRANGAAQRRTQSSLSRRPYPPFAPAQMRLQLFSQRTLRFHNNTSRKWRG